MYMVAGEIVRIERYIERLYPYVFGVVISAFLSSRFYDFIINANAYKISVSSIFSSTMTAFGILTGFLFLFYGLAIAPGGGFIGKIFKTETFRLFSQYVKEAFLLGFVLTIFSIPFSSAEFDLMSDLSNYWRAAASIWLAIFIASLLSFWRVARVFFYWVQANSKSKK